MVQVTFDTQQDSIEDLQEALRLLQDAIARKEGTVEATLGNLPVGAPVQETAAEPMPFGIPAQEPVEPKPEQPPMPTTEELQSVTGVLAEQQEQHDAEEAENVAHLAEHGVLPGETPLPKEETAIETPFFKITVPTEDVKEPSLKDMLDESLTDDEMSDMFRKHGGGDEKSRQDPSSDNYIEIVDFDEDEDDA
ncbi:MAG: hypothetical protein OXR66_09560 [Candidatus Woesearchaeota archaeon]|nr:hypothetical protein [Candidatus Woesearchaeota archaeon]